MYVILTLHCLINLETVAKREMKIADTRVRVVLLSLVNGSLICGELGPIHTQNCSISVVARRRSRRIQSGKSVAKNAALLWRMKLLIYGTFFGPESQRISLTIIITLDALFMGSISINQARASAKDCCLFLFCIMRTPKPQSVACRPEPNDVLRNDLLHFDASFLIVSHFFDRCRKKLLICASTKTY